ncbi:Gfo/Idh/MocA family protein [Vallitalea okinawensis]|uniref:Gfo/Idh/MocA family protein n=1 Tax=Vallitalea okinawensis TaxID=2078660 RepID=UPI000CFB2A5A|nr:Gfo/Idh/MocA family oxidoreductase [Vallitalea okinawensis]
MIKVGLIGLGMMGSCHYSNYLKLEKEGYSVKLVAICDKNEEVLQGKTVRGNLESDANKKDLSSYTLYQDIEELLNHKDLDYVDICLPSDLHKEVAIKAMEKGLHVLSEKPMALSRSDCQEMIKTGKMTGKKLMIAQCLRFWPMYQVLKEKVVSKEYGNVLAAHFYRRSTPPLWSSDDWMMDEKRSGGVAMDLHVHDVDIIQHIFGKPDQLSAVGVNKYEGAGCNHISAHFLYDNTVIHADASWIYSQGFTMGYSVVFEKATIELVDGIVMVKTEQDVSEIELSDGDGYYNEIKEFVNCILNDKVSEIATTESTMSTIELIELEKQSLEQKGKMLSC